MTPEEILKIKMEPNDADAETVKDYLKALVSTLWREGECFSGKRPFGNSSWEYDLYNSLVVAGVVKGRIEEGEDYRDVECDDRDAARDLINEAIKAL